MPAGILLRSVQYFKYSISADGMKRSHSLYFRRSFRHSEDEKCPSSELGSSDQKPSDPWLC